MPLKREMTTQFPLFEVGLGSTTGEKGAKSRGGARARHLRSQNEELMPTFKIVSQANLQQSMNNIVIFISEKLQVLTNEQMGTIVKT